MSHIGDGLPIFALSSAWQLSLITDDRLSPSRRLRQRTPRIKEFQAALSCQTFKAKLGFANL
jgi:hypothetical protein